MTKRLTEEEFFALPEAERTRLFDLEFKDYIFRDVCERAKTTQPVPAERLPLAFALAHMSYISASMVAGGSGGSTATDGRSLDERGGMKRA